MDGGMSLGDFQGWTPPLANTATPSATDNPAPAEMSLDDFKSWTPPPESTAPIAPKESGPKHEAPNAIEGTTNALTHGATFGVSDLTDAGARTFADFTMGKLDGGFGQTFDKHLANIRGVRQAFADEHPILATAANVVGGLAAAPVAGATAAVPTLAKAVGTGAVTGGTIGAIQGAADAEPGLANRAEGALTGGATGATIGAVVPPALIGGAKVAGMLAAPLRPFTKAGQQAIAGKVLDEAAGGRAISPETAPLPDMKLTAGQATNDPGLLWLERSVQQGSGDAKTLATDSRTANNQAIVKAIGGLGDTTAAEAAPATMADSLESALGVAKDRTRALWKAAGIDEAAPVSAGDLKGAVTSYTAGLEPAELRAIPPAPLADLQNLGDTVTPRTIQAIRSELGDALGTAARSGQKNAARIMGGLYEHLTQFLDNPATSGMTADQTAAVQAARASTKSDYATFDKPADIRKILGTDSHGADLVPESATANQVMRPIGSKGAPEAWQSYLDAIKMAPKATQDKALDAARSAFAQKFLDKISSVNKDQTGTSLAIPGKVSDFIDDYKHIINSPLFTTDQKNLIQSIAKASDMGARTSRAGEPGGSDTYAKLSGGNFLDAMIGKWPTKLASLASAGVGFATHGPIGGVVGAVEGGKLARSLYEAPKEKILKIITDAIHDPQLAKSLQMKATQGNVKFMPGRIQSYLATVMAQPAIEATTNALQ